MFTQQSDRAPSVAQRGGFEHLGRRGAAPERLSGLSLSIGGNFAYGWGPNHGFRALE